MMTNRNFCMVFMLSIHTLASLVSVSSYADPIGQCDDPATLIHQIQGSGLVSSLVETHQIVEAIVVGTFQGSQQLNGFFLQEETQDHDNNAATSEGLFVYAPGSRQLNIGDQVRVKGRVTEFFELTQLTDISHLILCASHQPFDPAIITLPSSELAFEALEGMAIISQQTLSVTDTFHLARFGSFTVSNGRLFQPTQQYAPGSKAVDLLMANESNRLLVDDGSHIQNPTKVPYPAPGLSAGHSLRLGTRVENINGVLGFSFGQYRLYPTQWLNFIEANPRSEPVDFSASANLTVASFNVLNYFNGDGQGGGFPTSRGANNASELLRQTHKIVSAIKAMDADILGLIELENDGYGPKSAIRSLTRALNKKDELYTFVTPGVSTIGHYKTAVGLIYKKNQVVPVGSAKILRSSIDSRFNDRKNRPVLAQTFQVIENGAKLTVAVTHLKSKASSCADIGDRDKSDGQGHCNQTRMLAAQAIADWLSTDPTESQDTDIMILGDLNSYAKEDPIRVLKTSGYTDLASKFLTDTAYSFAFSGQLGTLDYAMVTTTLLEQVVGVDIWHINADEPRALDYNTEFKTTRQLKTFYNADAFRSSDHDPIVVGLDLVGP